VRQRGAGARGADDVELGRRRVALRNGLERRRHTRRVAARHLVGGLGRERIAQPVDGVGQSVELAGQLVDLVSRERRRILGLRRRDDRRLVALP
jgi:hypothetical protein